MRSRSVALRATTVSLAGLLALTALVGCGRTSDDPTQAIADDPAVASVELVPGSSPELYEITLRDGLDGTELPQTAVRLSDITEDASDDRSAYAVQYGSWEWRLGGDEARLARTAEAVAALAPIEGVFHGTVSSGDSGSSVQVVSEAGVDPATLAAPVTEAIGAAALPPQIGMTFSDLQEQRVIESTDPANLAPVAAAIEVADAAGDIQQYSVTDDRFSLRMRAAGAAAAAQPAIDAALTDAPRTHLNITSGLVGVNSGADAAAAAAVGALLDPLPGIIDVRVDQRTVTSARLIVRVADAQTARATQEVLLGAPELAPYDALQFIVPDPDRPGSRIRSITTTGTPDAGALERAAALSAEEGVRSVSSGPQSLDVQLEAGADVVALAPAVKAAALRDQEVQIFASTQWGPYLDSAAYAFTVTGKTNSSLVTGSGDDRDAFVAAWNAAPAP